MRSFTVEERRARLARRQFLAEQAGSTDGLMADLVGLHATDPATPYLSLWARLPGFTVADLDAELFERRTLVKHLAMRRTLWTVRAEDLPLIQSGASDRVADNERRRLVADAQKAESPTTVPHGWTLRARRCCGISPNTVRPAPRSCAKRCPNWRGATTTPLVNAGAARHLWHQGF
jgi:Winged helix DNA-binding domain